MAQCWEWMAKSQYKTDVDSDDCMALDPTNAAARAMVATLFAEAAEIVGPAARHLHVGGDEVKFPCWNADPAIAAHVAKKYGNTTDAAYEMLQAEWTANVSAAAVVNAGKIPVLWQPTAEGPGDAAWDDAMPPNAVYMIWLNAESAAAYANVGKDVVYTTPFYVAGMGSSGCVSRCARACALAPRMPRASLLWSCGTVQKLWRSAHCFPCISLVCFVPRTLTSRRSQSSLCYSLSLSLPGVRTRARCSWTNVYNAPIMPAGLDPAAARARLDAQRAALQGDQEQWTARALQVGAGVQTILEFAHTMPKHSDQFYALMLELQGLIGEGRAALARREAALDQAEADLA